jgi:WD40 repeat protein
VILDLYEVLQVHQGGGMGLVYRVRHRGWGLDLAVKSPRPEFLAGEQDKLDFEREAETWVKLGLHPHMVHCHYVRRLGGIPRLFAEYVAGGSLAEWIRTGRLYQGGPEQALARLLDVAIQTAWGLQHAHEQGIVHQDVKPANVLLTPDGTAKVTDFGLARVRPTAASCQPGALTSALVSVGGLTPAYCSPEQAAGSKLSRKTDIWSWGLSVLEMFAGEVTWRAGPAAAEALTDYLRRRPASTSLPRMPTSLAGLLRQCFREEAARPANLRALVPVLREVYRQATGREYPRPDPRPAEALADGLNNRAVSLIDLGKHAEAEALWQEALRIDPQHIESNYHLGLLLWRSERLGGAALLQRLAALGQAHPNHWLVPYLMAQVLLAQGDRAAALQALEQIGGPDSQRPEVLQARAAAHKREPGAGSASRTFPAHSGAVSALCVSGDGRHLLSASTLDDALLANWDTLRLQEVDSGRPLRKFDLERGSVVAAYLSDDENTAAVLGRFRDAAAARSAGWDERWKLLLLEVSTGARRRVFHPLEDRVLALALSGDGRVILTGGAGGMLSLWDPAGAAAPVRWQAHEGAVTGLVTNKDGSRALSAGADGSVKVWEPAAGRCVRMLPPAGGASAVLAVDPGWQIALAGGQDGSLRFWDLEQGECQHTFTGHAGAVRVVCLAPDGRHALSGGDDGIVRYWECASGRCLRTLTGHTGAVTALAFARGGRSAFSGGADRTIREWALVCEDTAPFVLCRVTSSEQSGTTQGVYERSLTEARQALRRGAVREAADALRTARSQPGRERLQEAWEEWASLYLALPRQGLRGAWEARSLLGHTARVNSVSLTADGRQALSAGAEGTLRLWETATGRCTRTLENVFAEEERDGGRQFWATISSDGRHAFTGSGKATHALWRLPAGEKVRSFDRDFSGALLTPDGRYTLSAQRPNLSFAPVLCENATGRRLPLRTLADPASWILAASCLSPNAVAETLGLFDARNAFGRAFYERIKPIVSPRLSADGNYLLSGQGEQVAWSDMNTGQCLKRFDHQGLVQAVALTADGRFALSAGADARLRIWQIDSGRCVATLGGHTGEVTGVAVSAEGRLAVTASADQTLKVWALDWDLTERAVADHDAGVSPYLLAFLRRQSHQVGPLPAEGTPSPEEVERACRPRFPPTWDEPAFQGLLYTLGCAGFGWLRPSGVRDTLKKMAASLARNSR